MSFTRPCPKSTKLSTIRNVFINEQLWAASNLTFDFGCHSTRKFLLALYRLLNLSTGTEQVASTSIQSPLVSFTGSSAGHWQDRFLLTPTTASDVHPNYSDLMSLQPALQNRLAFNAQLKGNKLGRCFYNYEAWARFQWALTQFGLEWMPRPSVVFYINVIKSCKKIEITAQKSRGRIGFL